MPPPTRHVLLRRCGDGQLPQGAGQSALASQHLRLQPQDIQGTGSIVVEDDLVVGGDFSFDMTSILESGEPNDSDAITISTHGLFSIFPLEGKDGSDNITSSTISIYCDSEWS